MNNFENEEVEREVNILSRLSLVTKWSVLANLGNLPIMKAVILIPFVGILIIFNESVVSIFSLSSDFLNEFGIKATEQERVEFTVNSLYFLYFGLLFLGLGSIIFSFFCPKEIKGASNVDEYINVFDDKNSPVSTRINLKKLIGIKQISVNGWSRSEYADELFDTLIAEIYRELEARGLENAGGEYIVNAKDIDVDRIANVVYNEPGFSWAFTKPFQDVAVDFSGDILRCLYNFLELKFLYVRLIVAIFYVFGLVILFVPTVKTLLKVAF